jgi:hypothetical protein
MRRIFLCAAFMVISSAGLLAQSGHKPGPQTDPALVTYHNGIVLHSPKAQVIFWGSEWTDANFQGDVIGGFDTLLSGYGGSTYPNAPTEYGDNTGPITPNLNYIGHVIDSTTSPVDMTTSQGVAEICKTTSNNPDPNTLYLIVDSKDPVTRDCGWHSYGQCGKGPQAKPFQYAYTTNLMDSTALCRGVDDAQTATGHSWRLTRMANVAMHEVVETITNPRGGGWYDASGQEVMDKCKGVMAYPVFINGSVWKLQGVWSNAAYLAGTGALNASGQPGCVWQ